MGVAQYRLRLVNHEWTATFEPRTQDLMPGASGTTLDLRQAENGVWTDMNDTVRENGQVVMAGPRDNRYRLDLSNHIWEVAYLPAMQDVDLPGMEDACSLERREDGDREDEDMEVLMTGDSREVNGSTCEFTLDASGNWSAVRRLTMLAAAQIANHMSIALVEEGLQLDTIGALLIPIPSTAPPGTAEAFTVEGSEFMVLRGATSGAATSFGAVWKSDASALSDHIGSTDFFEVGLYARSANDEATTLPTSGTASYAGSVVARSQSLGSNAAPMSHQGTIEIEATWATGSTTTVGVDMSLPARSGSGMTGFGMTGGVLTAGNDELATGATIDYAGTEVTVPAGSTEVHMKFVAGESDTPAGVIGYFRVRDTGQTGSMELEWAGAFGADSRDVMPPANMQALMLGMSGQTLVLTEDANGMWTDAAGTAGSDNDVARRIGTNRLMYRLNTNSGNEAMPWRATFEVAVFELSLGNSGTDLTLTQAEDGTWTDMNDVARMHNGLVDATNGARYRLQQRQAPIGWEWASIFEPRTQTLELGNSGFSLMLLQTDQGEWREMNGFGTVRTGPRTVDGTTTPDTHTTSNGLNYELTMDSGDMDEPWAATYRPQMQMAPLEGMPGETYLVVQLEDGTWEDADMMALGEGDTRTINNVEYVFTQTDGNWMGVLQGGAEALAGTHLSNHENFRLGVDDMLLLNFGGSMAFDFSSVTPGGLAMTVTDAGGDVTVLTGETSGTADATFGVFWREDGTAISDDIDFGAIDDRNTFSGVGLFAHSPLNEMTIPPETGIAMFEGTAVAVSQSDFPGTIDDRSRQTHQGGSVTVEMQWDLNSRTAEAASVIAGAERLEEPCQEEAGASQGRGAGANPRARRVAGRRVWCSGTTGSPSRTWRSSP